MVGAAVDPDRERKSEEEDEEEVEEEVVMSEPSGGVAFHVVGSVSGRSEDRPSCVLEEYSVSSSSFKL